MKLILIGQSQSGKTTLAKQIAQSYGFQHISASNWVKQRWSFSLEDFTSREAYIKAITEYSLECLREDPNACVDYIREQCGGTDKTVIDGIRNPYDFVNLFDWRCDRCIHLIYERNPISTNGFEQGLGVIQAYLTWLLDNSLIQKHQMITLNFQAFHKEDHPSSLERWLEQLPILLRIGK